MTATATAYHLEEAPKEIEFGPRPQLVLIDGGGQGSSVEVYRRRRFFALVAASLLIVAGAWIAGVPITSFGAAATPIAAESAPLVHTVLPGDSYGAIAAELGVSNPAEMAEQLRAANGGAELVVGQRLVIRAAG